MGAWNQTHDEVREHTLPAVNRRIDALVEERVKDVLCRESGPALAQRIQALEHGWSAERAFALVSGAACLVGCALAERLGGRSWLVPAGVGVLLLEQSLTGSSVVMQVMRRLGLRTRRELDLEKFALKGLRGDFLRIPHEGGPELRANAALVAAQS
jgi:hypothetical protein